MIDIDLFGALRLLSGIAYAGLQLVVPVWLCVRLRLWGALLSVPFLWGLRLAWLLALPATDPHAEISYQASTWLIAGLPVCFIIACIVFLLTSIVTTLIRSRWPAPVERRGFHLHRIERYLLPCVLVALLLIGGLASIWPDGIRGPVFQTLDSGGTPETFSGTLTNKSSATLHDVVAVCEVVDDAGIYERFTFQRAAISPGEEWHVEAPIVNRNLLTRMNRGAAAFHYRTRVTAERLRIGPLRCIYRRDDPI